MQILPRGWDRRYFLAVCSRAGFAGTLFPGVLFAMAESKPAITRDMIDNAAAIAGIQIADEYKDMMLADLNTQVKDYAKIRDLHLANSVGSAVDFNPVLPGMKFESAKRPMRMSAATAGDVPKNVEELAFASVRQLGELVRARKVTSTALTEMYLTRLKRYDPLLKFVITYTEDRALAQAKEADKEIASGKYRGPLHGIPWGAKDMLATKGYKTTWGAGGFENQTIDEDATVVQRLDKAGAVLVAKLTLGALAMDDGWFGGMTRNPWKPEQGSSGSSAGPGSATSAGCVAFAMGSETLGSISSPSTRCGTTGLRPTFGRIPRTGAMALAYSMDKLGPMCRSVEDCALVLDAIYGPDGKDRTVHDVPFNWDANLDIRKLRIGYLKASFEELPKAEEKPETATPEEEKKQAEERARRMEQRKLDDASLKVLQDKLGLKLTEAKLPDLPWASMLSILTAECSASFDELTRSGRDRLLTGQKKTDWPNYFRIGRFVPAVEYINANRARLLGMEAMAKAFADFDVIVTPTLDDQLVITNLTGYPALILPNGFHPDGTPGSLTFLGQLFGEAKLLAVAKAYQDATDWHRKHPVLAPGVNK
jgi:Asp-tRNA(Asn)/Glu-tRNA(Gln) amidotransferase A subunit family amidase